MISQQSSRILVLLGLWASGTLSEAQPFAYNNNDLLLGFRKSGIHQETFEAVVNIGQATNYINIAAGTTISVPNFTPAQLAPETFSDLTFLSWSVLGYARTNTAFVLPGYPNNTLWLTVPRTNSAVQAVAPHRLNAPQQGAVGTKIRSIFSGAVYLSSQSSAGAYNTSTFVREPVFNSANLSTFLGSVVNSASSTLNDSWSGDIESTTPSVFNATSVADFYEIRPSADAQGNAIVDPNTGQSTGPAYYLGFFSLSSDGSLKFTRGQGTIVVEPPVATQLSVTRSESVTRITFPTQSNVSYTLYSTDAAGVEKPIAAWTATQSKIMGDGSQKQFEETANDQIRFYRVGAEKL